MAEHEGSKSENGADWGRAIIRLWPRDFLHSLEIYRRFAFPNGMEKIALGEHFSRRKSGWRGVGVRESQRRLSGVDRGES
jgi:hypothetical protein